MKLEQVKRVAAYCRCSTMEQDVAAQEQQIAEYVHHRGWKLVRIYRDRGVSGAKDNRPGLQQLLQDCRRGQVDVVVTQRLDRVGRTVRNLLTLLDEWRELGIAFVSVNEALDVTTAAGKLLLHLIAVFADYERQVIRERVRAGLQHAEQRGVRLGRPPVRRLARSEIAQLRRERAREKTPYRVLALRYGISVWSAHQLCQ